MKISYRGLKKDLPAVQKEKFDVKLAKLAKLLDGPSGEKEAHVVVTNERHLHNAEITLNYLGIQMVGLGSDADLFLALCKALEKAEKQVTKQRAKWRGKVRPSRRGGETGGTTGCRCFGKLVGKSVPDLPRESARKAQAADRG